MAAPTPPQRLAGKRTGVRGSAGAEFAASEPSAREIAEKSLREPPAPGRRAIRNHAAAFFLCLALGFVFTLPGSLSLHSGLLGYPGDNFQHAWFLWHFARAVAHGHDPFYTRLVFYPSRANLAWSTTDPIAGMLALPLSLFAGPVIAYNLSLILQLALGAFCARLLCLEISRDEAAAFIGGMIFGFSPYLMAHALAHLGLVTAFPIPLFVLALDRILRSEKPPWQMGIWLGLALLLAAWAHYNYAVLCLVFAVLLVALETWRNRSRVGDFLARIGKPVAVGAVTFIAGFSPLLWMMTGNRSEIPASRGAGHIERFSADALGFLIPSWNHVFLGTFARRMNPNLFAAGIEGTVYIGAVVLALAAVGFWRGRKWNRRWAVTALILGVAFYLLSLGPKIHVLAHELPVPGPAALLFDFPFVKFLSAPARFDAMLALCLAILCSLGARYLIERRSSGAYRCAVISSIVLLVLADYLTIPFPRSSTVDPGALYSSEAASSAASCVLPASLPSGTTILTFPLVKEPYCLKSMWMQVEHHGTFAIVDGYLSYAPPEIWKPFWNIPILRSLLSMEGLNRAPIDTAADAASAAATIRKLNLSAVVVYDSPERDAGVRYVEKVFGAEPERSGTCTVFALRASGSASGNRVPAGH